MVLHSFTPFLRLVSPARPLLSTSISGQPGAGRAATTHSGEHPLEHAAGVSGRGVIVSRGEANWC
jgi:hypothetical protein